MNHMMHNMLDTANLVSMFVIALGYSFSHCFAMCGGIVIAYSQIKIKGGVLANIVSHFLYSFGRITTYVIIGVICAYIGKNIAINTPTKGGFIIIFGFIMILFGIGFLFLPKILYILEPNIGNFRIFRWLFNFILKKKNIFSIYLLGLLNGAIPCGIVYFFAMNAALSNSIIKGAEIMLIFGLATLIPMFLLGIFNSLLKLTKYKNIILKISSIFVIIFGIYTIFKGFNILFSGD
ncbi:sulfite exporter TauE/SafE family protein [Helicobacter sp. MIT 14-3879]|uniref:sulfite exporter TauE/SafE family protein n=1 Tax=Helicobacter sp. MIT 14-3879 TaxID=2040649 RepID=UPI000E1F1246|nr:sulfite exporter TauE/SafE family protein [Helicobacter sp. MIT 14-3879]RDU63960.1 sulfite exporter TauE/SafE family protein [Helicobacter sp. MIT 14-3879]